MSKKILIIVVVVLAVIGGLYYVFSHGRPNVTDFLTAKVERGAMVGEVSCTGTVNPVTTVKVGAEVNGQVKELFADFNSEVTEGQLIARIDPEPYEVKVAQAEADLQVARTNVDIRKAAVEKAKADLENSRSDLAAAAAQTEKARVAALDAKRELDRRKALFETQSVPVRQLEQAEAAYDQAVASHTSAQAQQEAKAGAIRSREAQIKMETAQLAHAEALVEHRKTTRDDSKIELSHTAICSPVKGVVISRDVDIGQTVMARLQAPLLFTIAQDLRKIQVETSVDEADVGRIAVGQETTFTVDTFPGRKFVGVVDQIRKAPHLLQNVVTYTVIVSTDNSDLALLPGMTANVRIVVDKRSNVLKIPNAALRFRPPHSGSSLRKVAASHGASAKGREKSGAERLKRLIDALNMTKEQQAKIWALYGEERDRIKSLAAQGATRQQIGMALRGVRQKIAKGVEALLTPEQKEKYVKLKAGRSSAKAKPARIWVRGPDGKPMAVKITTGISDGAFTEVVSGDLAHRQEVIVGIAKRASSNGIQF